MPTNNMVTLKWPKYLWYRICNFDAQIIDWISYLSIWTRWTSQKNGKSNNDEQCNTSFRRRNHEEQKTYIYVKITYLDWIRGKKVKKGDF